MTRSQSARFRSVPDVAAELGVSEEWIRRQVRAGRFPHYRIAQQIRFTDADVDAIIAALAVPVAPQPDPPAAGPPPPRRVNRRYAVYPATQH
jgi:excisionase family DNA binding protein